MLELYTKTIAEAIGVKIWQVENCLKLFEDGATIPFISRYRKERTGGLDEVAIAEIRHLSETFDQLHKRKATILQTIEQAGSLTDDLKQKIDNCVDSKELEDLYLPYRPKRRTRATVAKEAGLEPLADRMFSMAAYDPRKEAARYLSDKVPSVEDALQGARDIIAERV
ncbi:MAG: RNA-binding transcriptional accessory protein, partial [Bacteroidales bacterium]|nr:RNA-binding transcriptional accessory protein [Bacteroidales bacterium]